MRNVWKEVSFMMFALSLGSLCMGFYKLFFYSNEDYDELVNVYVEGDAYNYIINGAYATAYFVLMGSFLIAGVIMQILHKMDESKYTDNKAKKPLKKSPEEEPEQA